MRAHRNMISSFSACGISWSTRPTPAKSTTCAPPSRDSKACIAVTAEYRRRALADFREKRCDGPSMWIAGHWIDGTDSLNPRQDCDRICDSPATLSEHARVPQNPRFIQLYQG